MKEGIIKKDDIDLIYDNHINISIIKDRLDNAYPQLELKVDKLGVSMNTMKLDIMQAIHDIELKSAKADTETKVKVGVLSALVSIIITFLTVWINSKIGK